MDAMSKTIPIMTSLAFGLVSRQEALERFPVEHSLVPRGVNQKLCYIRFIHVVFRWGVGKPYAFSQPIRFLRQSPEIQKQSIERSAGHLLDVAKQELVLGDNDKTVDQVVGERRDGGRQLARSKFPSISRLPGFNR